MNENDGYFVVETKDGTMFTFDQKCNYFEYSDPNYCIFQHKIDSLRSVCLACIPHEEISYIIRRDK